MTLTAGQMLQSRYRIISQLGQGGMGAVYRAWDTRLNVPVALKEMTHQPGLDTQMLAQLRQQFQQEAQILARLSHPHLVRVGDFFEERGNTYLVMDFVEGENLADRIDREGALPEAQVLTWARQLLGALAYCHERGVLHRDIKPQNVIIRPDGQAVLVDFGLVKLWDPNDPHTRTVMQGMGTPEYSPPEQYGAQTGHTDPRSDIYSVGATIYHALVSQAPPTATLRMADPEKFIPPRQAIPQVSQKTEAVVLKALELTRSNRWESATEMAAALPVPSPTSLQPPGLTAPATRRYGETRVAPAAPATTLPRRVPGWIWTLGGLVVLALLVVAVTRGIGEMGVMGDNPTPTSTSPPTPAATPTPRPSHTPTRTPTHTPTPTPRATKTPRPTSTPMDTPRPTSTPMDTPRPSPVATDTPPPPTAIPTAAPQVVEPVLVMPTQGGEYKNPITFQWNGSLSADQAYQVTAYHNDSQTVLQSELLTDPSWIGNLPADKYGEWRWRVSVVQGGSALTTSPEWMFWFTPFPGGGEPSGPPAEPTREGPS
jgi:serine/threonine protein kinase